MKVYAVFIVVFLKIIFVENRMLPKVVTIPTEMEQGTLDSSDEGQDEGSPHEKVIGLGRYEENDEAVYDVDRGVTTNRVKKPCAVVVVSNMQNPNMQSLLRKYRYDSNGVLIRDSVQYFLKLPQGDQLSPLLVPLNSKSFSPLGGFVRYYKEVPPIPHSWQL